MLFRVFTLITLCITFFTSHSQKLIETTINVSSGSKADKRGAIVYLPVGYSASKAYPLVIFTHGMGQAGTKVKKLYSEGLPKVLKKGYRPPFKFIMVAVQRNSFSVKPEWLAGILKDTKSRWKIDTSRIYLTGLSAGGWSIYGSQLNFSPAFAKKFAAIVVNSGVTQNTNKDNFDWWKETKTPLWAIVGAADKGYVGKNAYMVNEINKRVPNLATLTVRAGIGHGGWTEIYNGKVKLNGKNMWEWLYQFKRAADGASKPPAEVEETPVVTTPTPTTPTAQTKYIRVNIYKGVNPYTSSNYNNWNISASDAANLKTGTLKYDDGSSSAVTAVLSSSYLVEDNGADYGGGIAPAGVLRYGSYDTKKRTLTITGLSTTKKYAISLFSTRHRHSKSATAFTINGTKQSVVTNNNLTRKAAFDGISPDAQGRISITIESSVSRFNHLNGFIISEPGTK